MQRVRDAAVRSELSKGSIRPSYGAVSRRLMDGVAENYRGRQIRIASGVPISVIVISALMFNHIPTLTASSRVIFWEVNSSQPQEHFVTTRV